MKMIIGKKAGDLGHPDAFPPPSTGFGNARFPRLSVLSTNRDDLQKRRWSQPYPAMIVPREAKAKNRTDLDRLVEGSAGGMDRQTTLRNGAHRSAQSLRLCPNPPGFATPPPRSPGARALTVNLTQERAAKAVDNGLVNCGFAAKLH